MLDKNYNIHDYLKGIVMRCKGIQHYGFDYDTRLCIGGIDNYPRLSGRSGINLTFYVNIKIMKPKSV